MSFSGLIITSFWFQSTFNLAVSEISSRTSSKTDKCFQQPRLPLAEEFLESGSLQSTHRLEQLSSGTQDLKYSMGEWVEPLPKEKMTPFELMKELPGFLF